MLKTRMQWIVATGAMVAFLVLPVGAMARSVTIIPKTQHSALTLTTDGSYGFMVKPKKPLKLDLVGPGRLTITLRLNHPKKKAAYKGQFQIRRNNKRIKKSNLKLFRSRVGAYEEDSRIKPSMPKVFNIRVPRGLQHYSFILKGARGLSMTLGIDYDTKADQGAAQDTDDLALVPLIAPGTPEPDDVPLVALAPLTPKKPEKKPTDKPEPVKDSATKVEPEPKKPEPVVEAVEQPKKPEPVVEAVEQSKKPDPVEKDPPVKVAVAQDDRPGALKPGTVETIEPKVVNPPTVEGQAPKSTKPFFAVGAKIGQISPLQSIGTTSLTAALDIRYVLPVFDGRLSLGLEAGYHKYAMKVDFSNTSDDLQADMVVLPISLQLFYRLPLGSFIEPFIGAGADLLLTWAEVAYTNDPSSKKKGSAIGFGGHVTVGAETKLGPGYLFLEVAAGFSSVDVEVISGANVSGLSTVAGYRFEF